MKLLVPCLRGARIAALGLVALGLTAAAPSAFAQSANITATYKNVDNNGMSPNANGESGINWNFGNTSITTFNGWQYTAYWNDDGTGTSNYHVSVARRQLPSGNWAAIKLTDYDRDPNDPQGFGDGHEKVSLGISPDGYIHLAFDHHNDPLRYRRSINPIANNPGSSGWSASLFGAVDDDLGAGTIDDVCYPEFYADYANSKFVLYIRTGGSGDGDGHLFNYNSSTHAWDINTTASSRFITRNTTAYSDGDVCPYPAGFEVSANKIYTLFTWRGTPAGDTCFDIAHIYSANSGVTWRNNKGAIIGTRGASDLVSASDPDVTGVNLATGRIINGNFTMAVTPSKDIYVYYRDYQTNQRYIRKYEANGNDTNGTWSAAVAAPALDSPVMVATPNGSVFIASTAGLYQVLNNNTLWLAKAKPSSANYGPADIAVDLQRAKAGIITVIGQTSGTQVFTVDYSNLPGPQ